MSTETHRVTNPPLAMQHYYLALVFCSSYLMTALSVPENYYGNQMQEMDEESFPIPPPDDYQRERFFSRQMITDQLLTSEVEGSIFDIPNNVEDGSAADVLTGSLRGKIDEKVVRLDARLKDLNIKVLENTLQILKIQQEKVADRQLKGKLDRQSGNIRNISDSVRRLEEMLVSQSNPDVLARIQEQASLLENLTETLKEAVVISQQNEEEIAALKQARGRRLGFTIGRLDEQAVLMKDIQKDIAVIQMTGETTRGGTGEWRDFSLSVLDMQRRIDQVERLVAVIKKEVNEIEDDLKDDIDENKQRLNKQGGRMLYMTYNVHRIEDDLEEFTEDQNDVIEDIRHSINRLTAENKDQWVDIDTLDDTVDNMQKHCCEQNVETVNSQIARINSDISQFRSVMDDCIAGITDQIKGINLKLGDYKAESDIYRSRLAYLEDQIKIEEMKREQSERHYSTLLQKANSAVTNLQEKQSYDIVGIKASINNLMNSQQESSEEFIELRTRIEYLEREDISLDDDMQGIRDTILKLTDSISHSADSNRNFLQQLIHDLLDGKRRN